MVYLVAKCPRCNYAFIVSVSDVHSRVRCRSCNKSFTLVYKRNPWRHNLAVYKKFASYQEALEALKKFKLLYK